MAPADAASASPRSRGTRWLLVAALLLGLLARAPGIYWGWNFPSGWGLHHPDEFTHLFYAKSLIDPSQDQHVRVQPYPHGLGAMTAVPILAWRAARGELRAPFPPDEIVITTGRILAVLCGTATVLAVFLLARHLTPDVRIAHAAAFWTALGGLHVTQSHFFVADVPALLCLLVAQLCLLHDRDAADRTGPLGWAALSLGVAFGLKLSVAALPTLALITLARAPRFRRTAYAAVFFTAGFAAVNLLTYTPLELLDTLREGTGDQYHYDRLMGIVVYLVELPAILGIPLLAFSLAGLVWTASALRKTAAPRVAELFVVLGLPVLIHAWLVAVRLDSFPRHLITFIPYLALAAGLGLVRATDALRARGWRPAWLLGPVFAYQLAVVIDGERGFIREPRNDAYRWMAAHVPPGTPYYWSRRPLLAGYPSVRFPDAGRPPFLFLEMFDVNPFLSGVGFRDSYPTDFRAVFDAGRTPARMEAYQDLFRGRTEYREVARFGEHYVMPEFRIADRVLGNRSRNYLTTVVVFQRPVTP